MKKQDGITGLTKRIFLYTGALTAALSGVMMSGCTQTTEAPTATASAPASVEAALPAAKEAAPAIPVGAKSSPDAVPPPGSATAGGAPAMPGGANAPFAGGMGGSPSAPLSPTPELDKKIADADKSKDKKAITAAYTARGAFRLKDEAAGARIKYRAALEDFRKALAADPTNASAKASKDTIESIYTSMGRPIPK